MKGFVARVRLENIVRCEKKFDARNEIDARIEFVAREKVYVYLVGIPLLFVEYERVRRESSSRKYSSMRKKV
jgi:hypothetical protein